jgi:hypothetical protein
MVTTAVLSAKVAVVDSGEVGRSAVYIAGIITVLEHCLGVSALQIGF